MRIKHRATHQILTLFSKWLCTLSEDERDHFAVRIARIGYHLLQIRKKDALQNLSIAFPEKSIEERISILKRTYAFFSRSFLQFLAIKKSFRFVKINTIDHELLNKGLEKGKGVILATAHFSKWEVMSTWLGNHDYPCIAVAQKQKNVGADIFFRELRQETGMGMIYRKSAIKHMYRILAENKILILASDQDAKHRGVFVDFFGQKASTPKGVARFHQQSGSDILFISCYVENNGSYTLHVQKVQPEETSVESITQAFTSILEEKVKAYPEQYFWFHRRWKTKPNTTL